MSRRTRERRKSTPRATRAPASIGMPGRVAHSVTPPSAGGVRGSGQAGGGRSFPPSLLPRAVGPGPVRGGGGRAALRGGLGVGHHAAVDRNSWRRGDRLRWVGLHAVGLGLFLRQFDHILFVVLGLPIFVFVAAFRGRLAFRFGGLFALYLG